MKKFNKSKYGFTLVEMVTVIAIILILASVLFFSVLKYTKESDAAKKKVDSKASQFSSGALSKEKAFSAAGY